MFCKTCGTDIPDTASICMKCGVMPEGATALGASVANQKSRLTYILLGFFLGALGIHNFYAGYTGRAVAQLLLTLFTGWLLFPLIAIGIWVLIEICITKQDAHGLSFS